MIKYVRVLQAEVSKLLRNSCKFLMASFDVSCQEVKIKTLSGFEYEFIFFLILLTESKICWVSGMAFLVLPSPPASPLLSVKQTTDKATVTNTKVCMFV